MNIIEYILRFILFIQAIISLIGTIWFLNSLSMVTSVFGILLTISAISVSLLQPKRIKAWNLRMIYVVISALGAISAMFFAYRYGIKVQTHGASEFRVISMLIIGCIFIYFSGTGLKKDRSM